MDWIIDNDYLNVIRCCEDCGKVLEESFFTDEPTFQKNSAGLVMELRFWIVKLFGLGFCFDL